MKITSVRGREILDSRGNPTVEVDVTLAGGGKNRIKLVAISGDSAALMARLAALCAQ